MRGEIRDEMCVFYSNGFIWKIPPNQNKKKAEVGVLLPISVVLVLREVTKKDLSVFANQTDGVSRLVVDMIGQDGSHIGSHYTIHSVSIIYSMFMLLFTQNTLLLVCLWLLGFFWIF